MDSEAFHSSLCHQILAEEVLIFHVTTSIDRVPFRELGRSYGMSTQAKLGCWGRSHSLLNAHLGKNPKDSQRRGLAHLHKNAE